MGETMHCMHCLTKVAEMRNHTPTFRYEHIHTEYSFNYYMNI